MSRLPPFLPLVAFEAAARLGSFTRAAAELGVTQSAVSHQIRRLETHFGTALIERRRDGLRPTAAGARLLPELREAFDLLSGLSAAAAEVTTLRVGMATALSTWWLARRLPTFAELHPDIAIEVVPFENAQDAASAEVDIRLLWVRADEAQVTATQRPLVPEQVFPVCHPSLLPRKRPLRRAADLAALPLIHKGNGHAEQGREWNWSSWIPGAKPNGALRFREIGAALAAAVDGAGVALGRSLLVQDAISDGRLARALPPQQAMPSSKRHVVRWSKARATEAQRKLLVDWLAEEAERTLEATG